MTYFMYFCTVLILLRQETCSSLSIEVCLLSFEVVCETNSGIGLGMHTIGIAAVHVAYHACVTAELNVHSRLILVYNHDVFNSDEDS